jgi:hypothetical protein
LTRIQCGGLHQKERSLIVLLDGGDEGIVDLRKRIDHAVSARVLLVTRMMAAVLAFKASSASAAGLHE